MGRSAGDESGSALLMSMIMLFMISIMGISVMQSSSLEYRMATNAIETKAVFQSAESVTEAALNDDDNLSLAFNAGTENFIKVDLTMDAESSIDSEAKLEYIGGSVIDGSSIGTFEGLRFIAYGSGLRDGIAGAGVTQGAVRIVPAN